MVGNEIHWNSGLCSGDELCTGSWQQERGFDSIQFRPESVEFAIYLHHSAETGAPLGRIKSTRSGIGI